MTKNDLFRIIIKLIGLYWIVTTLYTQLPIVVSVFLNEFNIKYLPSIISYFIVSVLLIVLLIFNTDKVILWLKLIKGFDEDRIEFLNFDLDGILKVALIIVGCILIVNNLATFFIQTYYFVKLNISMNVNDTVNYISQNDYLWAISFIDIILGYLLLTNYPTLSKFLIKLTQKKED